MGTHPMLAWRQHAPMPERLTPSAVPPSAGPRRGPDEPEKFSRAMQFANTAIGDTALALSADEEPTGSPSAGNAAGAAVSAPPLSGSFGPYEILRQAGTGGMGVVYEAIDSRNGAHVALKSLLRMG